MTAADIGPWLPPKAWAERLGISADAVHALCTFGEIDHRIVNKRAQRRRYLISEQAVDRYIANDTVRATKFKIARSA